MKYYEFIFLVNYEEEHNWTVVSKASYDEMCMKAHQLTLKLNNIKDDIDIGSIQLRDLKYIIYCNEIEMINDDEFNYEYVIDSLREL